MSLQFTDCKKCKIMYLVGIDEKDITKARVSGGKNFLSVPNEEIEKAPKLIAKKIKCRNCGSLCTVKEGKTKLIRYTSNLQGYSQCL